jgi:hypothetical protein
VKISAHIKVLTATLAAAALVAPVAQAAISQPVPADRIVAQSGNADVGSTDAYGELYQVPNAGLGSTEAYGELYQFPNAGFGSTEAYGELYQFPNAGLDPVVGTVPVAAPGFDYGDAVIGAAIAFCAALLAAAGVLALRRSRRSATLA